jgi:hypothetical protein
LFLLTSIIGFSQNVKVKREAERLFIFENGIVKDTIMLHRPSSAKHRQIGNFLYYTDGFFVPDILRLVLYRVDITNVNASRKELLVKSFNLNYDYPVKLRLKNDRLVLIHSTSGKRNKTIVDFMELQ